MWRSCVFTCAALLHSVPWSGRFWSNVERGFVLFLKVKLIPHHCFRYPCTSFVAQWVGRVKFCGCNTVSYTVGREWLNMTDEIKLVRGVKLNCANTRLMGEWKTVLMWFIAENVSQYLLFLRSKTYFCVEFFKPGMSNWRLIMYAARENILRSADSTANQKSVITICRSVFNFPEKNNHCVAIFFKININVPIKSNKLILHVRTEQQRHLRNIKSNPNSFVLCFD